MILLPGFAHQHVAVFGLARSGIAAARALMASGAHVSAWDDGEAVRTLARTHDIPLSPPEHIDWTNITALILAPGVPLYFPAPHRIVALAHQHHVPIICDIELFAQTRTSLPRHKVIGITGTNGKSTTTALIAHILSVNGIAARASGNIGLAVLDQSPLPTDGCYVLELSSYQLDLTRSLACDVAVLLNITPDHLDRHGTMARYAQAKRHLFTMQTQGATAVIASDDDYCCAIAGDFPHVAISARRRLAQGVSIVDGLAYNDNVRIGAQADWPDLAGPHNAQNAAAAIATCLAFGIALQDIVRAMESFVGLPHRMERVAMINNILYVNDSKATNPQAAAPALAAYPHIHWILGGKRKGDSLDACLPWLDHVRRAYVIGEAEQIFAEILAPHLPVDRCGTLAEALRRAHLYAHPGEVVLLAPACASQDQFTDYEARGQHFRDLVAALEESRA